MPDATRWDQEGLCNLMSGNSLRGSSAILAFPFDVGFGFGGPFFVDFDEDSGGEAHEGIFAWEDTRIARDRCVAVRRPSYKSAPVTAKPVQLAASGALSANEA